MARRKTNDVATALLNAPLGLTAMRIFLWLISVGAALGLLMLLVLRPSLVYTSASLGPSDSQPTTTTKSTMEVDSGNLEMGAVCTFPLEESTPTSKFEG